MDWAVGGEGDDIIYGSRDKDVLHGGAGRDFIWGGGGDDIILGDGDLYQEAFYGETPEGGLMGIEFQQVFYKDNQGLLWRTEIAPDGTLTRTEITDEYELDPVTGQPVINPATGEYIVTKPGYMLIYSPRGWSIVVTEIGNLTDFQHINNAGGNGFRIDPKALSDLTPGAADDMLFGGEGNDYIVGQVGNDILDGGDPWWSVRHSGESRNPFQHFLFHQNRVPEINLNMALTDLIYDRLPK